MKCEVIIDFEGEVEGDAPDNPTPFVSDAAYSAACEKIEAGVRDLWDAGGSIRDLTSVLEGAIHNVTPDEDAD